jgi:flagellar motor switch protein FliM
MEKAIAITGMSTDAPVGAMSMGLDLVRMPPAAPWMSRIEEHPAWEILSAMRMRMRAEVPLSHFTVRKLLALAEGQVFETMAPDTEDVPVRVGQVQMGWSEFEVVEQRMALRLTRLE